MEILEEYATLFVVFALWFSPFVLLAVRGIRQGLAEANSLDINAKIKILKHIAPDDSIGGFLIQVLTNLILKVVFICGLFVLPFILAGAKIKNLPGEVIGITFAVLAALVALPIFKKACERKLESLEIQRLAAQPELKQTEAASLRTSK